MAPSDALLESVNISAVRSIEHRGRTVQTGIFKEPVAGPVAVGPGGLEGDAQADRRVHGGEDKAVYAYALEDYAGWMEELARPLSPGAFGENLTTSGVDVSGALVGERWSIGTVLLEVSQPRSPCYKLGIAMGDDRFPVAFREADLPGAYLRVIEPGVLSPGDTIEVHDRPQESLRVAEVARISSRDHAEAERLLGLTALSESVKEWARKHT